MLRAAQALNMVACEQQVLQGEQTVDPARGRRVVAAHCMHVALVSLHNVLQCKVPQRGENGVSETGDLFVQSRASSTKVRRGSALHKSQAGGR